MPQPKQRFCSEAPSPVNPHKHPNMNASSNHHHLPNSHKRGVSINTDTQSKPTDSTSNQQQFLFNQYMKANKGRQLSSNDVSVERSTGNQH